MKKNQKQGFTLIELLVVIAIIGLIATLSVIALNNARAKSRDAKRVSDIKQMQTALELYFNDAQAYPATGNIISGQSITYGSSTYMQIIPTSPTPNSTETGCGGTDYTYVGSTDGTYTLKYCLEGNVGSITKGLNTATNASIK